MEFSIPSPSDLARRVRLGVDARVIDDRYHGIGRSTYEVLKELVKDDRFHIVLFVNPSQDSARLDLPALLAGGQFEVVSFNQSMTSPLQQVAWPIALRRAKIDAILFPYHLGAAMIGGGRRFVMVHDCIFEADPAFAPNRKTLLMYRMLTWLVTHRSTVLTPSSASADRIRHYYRVPMQRWQVVPWGVFLPQLATTAELAEPILPVLPAKYFLHVGAHRPHKNVALLVDVLVGLRVDEHLVLVGSDDQRWPASALDLARRLGVDDRVVRLTDVSDAQLQLLYDGAQAFLYPSIVEGFGLPLLEAMASGVPVIASDIPAFREVAADAALLAAPDDAAAWVAAIRRLDDGAVRTALIARGYQRARKATWKRAGDALASALTHSG